jgi:FkbM family methyltransferase
LHAREGGIAYDVGAHVGFFSLLMSRLVGRTGQVLAFEPHTGNVERLRANVFANGARNVDVRAVALGDAVGEERFSAHASSLEGSLDGGESVAGGLPDDGAPALGCMRVATTTIDALVHDGAAVPHVMKIDVEGAEGRVIRGGRETIAACRPVMVIEIHSSEAWGHVLDALPVAYEFTDIDGGRDARLREPGHYLALPAR